MAPGRGRPRRPVLLRLLRSATAHRRSGAGDLVLAVTLAFVAGAVNAGGFLAIGQYTSHMTGIVSVIADNLVLGGLGLVGAGLVALSAFLAGAACSAILINWGRRNTRARQYALPILLEAALLLGFGLLGGAATRAGPLALALPLLCFVMGLQNATITKLSGARIRTTHLTGMVTDIGIELGKMAYASGAAGRPLAMPVVADRAKLSLLAALVATFLAGGVTGALGFKAFGTLFCLPLSAMLFALTWHHMRPAARPPSMPG